VSKALPSRKLYNAKAQHRCGHDGQRKRVAHMPHSDNIKSSTINNCQQIEIGWESPTRLRDEAIKEGLGNACNFRSWLALQSRGRCANRQH